MECVLLVKHCICKVAFDPHDSSLEMGVIFVLQMKQISHWISAQAPKIRKGQNQSPNEWLS